MGYWRELRTQWRPLFAAMLGLGAGFSTTSYVTSIMAPHMLQEFGWTKSQFAAAYGMGFVSTLAFPFVGRMADVLGVRWTALIGVLSLPISFLAITMMSGNLTLFIAIFMLQCVTCITTTTTVYSRIVVQYITLARGTALAIVASGPALFGVFGAPLLNAFVQAHGWRAGYYAAAAYALTAGLCGLLIMPPERRQVKGESVRPRRAREDYPEIFRKPAFWILLAAMVLCNLPQVVAISQLNMVMMENGVTPLGVSKMISGFAIGTLAGRFLAGLTVDRMPAYLVAFGGMMLASIGLFLIASPWDAEPVLWVGILLIGLSFGTETDVIGYLVVQTFGVRVFSSVMGLMTAAMAVAASGGSGILSVMLRANKGYAPFLLLAGSSVLIGSVLFLFLPRARGEVETEALPDGQPQAA